MTIVGIDLGTTHSLCGVFEAGAPRLLPNAAGGLLTPSLVGVLEDGRVVVGAAARDLALTRPERVARGFKRLMGTDTETRLSGQAFSAPQLSSLVLRALKADAEAALSVPVDEAVISVPAYFNDHQRQATRLGRGDGLDRQLDRRGAGAPGLAPGPVRARGQRLGARSGGHPRPLALRAGGGPARVPGARAGGAPGGTR